MTEQELEEKGLLYDAIYEMGQALIKVYNPCRFGDDGKCAASRKFECHHNDFCCSGCEHVAYDGCSVKCLGCKLSFCSEAAPNLPAAAHRLLNRLREVKMNHFGYHVSIRTSKEQAFEYIMNDKTEKVIEAAEQKFECTMNDETGKAVDEAAGLTITKEVVKYDDAIVVKKYDDVTKKIISSEVFKS